MRAVDAGLMRVARAAPMLSAEDEAELAAAARAGDRRARDRMVLAHLRMAVAAAARFRRYGVPADDLVQEAAAALARAVDKFDPAMGVRFASFAAYTLRGALGDAVIRGSSTVRPATDVRSKRIFFLGRYERHRIERGGDLTPGQVDRELARRLGVSARAVAEVSAAAFGAFLLDAPVEEGISVGDTLADGADAPDVVVQRGFDAERRRAAIDDALSCLDERERAIVSARHYVQEGDGATLEELGSRFGISKERIRQLEGKALRKLRSAMAPRRAELGLSAS